MEKEVYLVIIKWDQQYAIRKENGGIVVDFNKTDAQYNVETFRSYDSAVSYIDKLVEGQKTLETNVKFEYYGTNRGDLFERCKTTVHGWPFNKVLYGVEAITETANEVFVMNRFIVKQNIL